ncbi:cytochrome b-c1 complex subunit 8-like [Pollicipes pollicipes]|uniref:cytochrome b-c1 complex subunit 8-like n=1 Tax=Pollicipes pollicipes TaxID=41117 RepID=UPI001885514F|nr:cytochrome b-c1 complex subunit 8-like [Pollicipes pollicipes]XP_037070036.1 cytochrome b-c1 complex subunit 8-like [Pollicipes pollicipes]XP_037070037.1 cytochrome b-c1 complex subunit 8-like [Pollicipes pollicipes]
MGLGFGNLHKSRGVVSYRLSPFEQRAFAGISKAPLNMLRRIRGNVFTVAPPFLAAYLLYTWGEAEHTRLSRKNPADYANDV